jgi:alpha-pyrone synthase
MKRGTLAIFDDHAFLMPNTEDGITLSVNANGISCTLSRRFPWSTFWFEYPAAMWVLPWRSMGWTRRSWTLGSILGRRIIEGGAEWAGADSHPDSRLLAGVLAKYGNMLSPSIMFVLERVFARHEKMLARARMATMVAFSFSPESVWRDHAPTSRGLR